jgi:hypothetical protein
LFTRSISTSKIWFTALEATLSSAATNTPSAMFRASESSSRNAPPAPAAARPYASMPIAGASSVNGRASAA